MNKLLFVGYSAQNRTQISGYEHIVDFKSEDYETSYLDATSLPFGFIPTGVRGKRINLYFLEMISHLKAKGYDIVHNFYCDNQLLLRYKRNRNFGAIATTHLNYKEFTDFQMKVLDSYDQVIVLSSAEEKYLCEKGINCVYIPHGFSKPVFKRDVLFLEKYAEKINICFSGVCYRNYDILLEFIQLIRDRTDVVLHVLGQREHIKKKLRAMNQSNVIIYDFLSDDAYYSVMSYCDYSFLPLIFATANNTLLEAQFLGVKTILSDIEGTNDYASREYNLFFKNTEELNRILGKLKKEKKCEGLINYSEQYQWSEIYTQTKKVYDAVIKKYK